MSPHTPHCISFLVKSSSKKSCLSMLGRGSRYVRTLRDLKIIWSSSDSQVVYGNDWPDFFGLSPAISTSGVLPFLIRDHPNFASAGVHLLLVGLVGLVLF